MTTLCHKPADMAFDADTRATLMGLRWRSMFLNRCVKKVTHPEIRRILRKEITVTQFDIRAIERTK